MATMIFCKLLLVNEIITEKPGDEKQLLYEVVNYLKIPLVRTG